MPNYFYNNNPVPESQLLRLSEENNMTLDEFLKSMPDIVIEDAEIEEPEQLGWGKKLSNFFTPDFSNVEKQQARTSFDPKSSIRPDLYTQQKREKEIEISEKERKSTKEYSTDKVAFEKELNEAFKNPNTLREILDTDETLQNVLIGAGGQPVRNPEAALKDYIHDQVKGFGWMSNGERTIDPNTGQTYYPNLTNRDIDELIDGVFDQQYSQESKNNRNSCY